MEGTFAGSSFCFPWALELTAPSTAFPCLFAGPRCGALLGAVPGLPARVTRCPALPCTAGPAGASGAADGPSAVPSRAACTLRMLCRSQQPVQQAGRGSSVLAPCACSVGKPGCPVTVAKQATLQAGRASYCALEAEGLCGVACMLAQLNVCAAVLLQPNLTMGAPSCPTVCNAVLYIHINKNISKRLWARHWRHHSQQRPQRPAPLARSTTIPSNCRQSCIAPTAGHPPPATSCAACLACTCLAAPTAGRPPPPATHPTPRPSVRLHSRGNHRGSSAAQRCPVQAARVAG